MGLWIRRGGNFFFCCDSFVIFQKKLTIPPIPRNLFHIMAKRNSFIHTDKLIGEVTKYLKEKGEEEKIDVNKFDKDGRNPLMHLWYSDANGSFVSLFFPFNC